MRKICLIVRGRFSLGSGGLKLSWLMHSFHQTSNSLLMPLKAVSLSQGNSWQLFHFWASLQLQQVVSRPLSGQVMAVVVRSSSHPARLDGVVWPQAWHWSCWQRWRLFCYFSCVSLNGFVMFDDVTIQGLTTLGSSSFCATVYNSFDLVLHVLLQSFLQVCHSSLEIPLVHRPHRVSGWEVWSNWNSASWNVSSWFWVTAWGFCCGIGVIFVSWRNSSSSQWWGGIGSAMPVRFWTFQTSWWILSTCAWRGCNGRDCWG